MARESADLRAKAFVAVAAGMTLVCLIGALAMPGVPRGPWLLGPVLLFVAVPFLSRIADRSRVGHAVGEMGGELLALRRWRFWEDDLDRHWTTYDVVFRDRAGAFHLATCRTGMLWAVQWVGDAAFEDEDSLRAAAARVGWREIRFRQE